MVVVVVVVAAAAGGGGGGNTDIDCIHTAVCRFTSFSSKIFDVSTASCILQKHISIQPSADCVYHIAY